MRDLSFHVVLLMLLAFGTSHASLTYTHNWVDDAGHAHLTTCSVTNLTKTSVGPGISPSFLEKLGPAEGFLLNVMTPQPAGVEPVWHRNPVVQFVMFQSGLGNWTVPGETVMFKAGDLMLGEDQNATVGHQSSARGTTNLTMAIIQFDWIPRVNQPCWLK